MTYSEILDAATRSKYGGYVNTDGDWCLTRSPEEFSIYLSKIVPFDIILFGCTCNCSAFVVFSNNLKCYFNGFCTFIGEV